jgi:hypothetical protein
MTGHYGRGAGARAGAWDEPAAGAPGVWARRPRCLASYGRVGLTGHVASNT